LPTANSQWSIANGQLPMVNGWQSGAAACGWRIGDWQVGCGAARTPATAAVEDRARPIGVCYFCLGKSRGEVLQVTTDCVCTNELNIKSLIWLSQKD